MAWFIPSKTNNALNGRPLQVETVTGWCMVNPHRPSVFIDEDTLAVSDSGAFQKDDMLHRLTAEQALARQLAFEASTTKDGRRRFPRGFAAIVTYDMLVGVDEVLVDGKRVKRRGTAETATEAVRQTLISARHYYENRHRVKGAIAYAAQGATLEQYVGCVRTLLRLARPGRDWLALGGFCIIGMQTSLKPLFAEVCREVAPLMAARGIHRVHILGVCVVDVLAVAATIFAEYGIEFTTDSSAIEVNSVMGKVWHEDNMRRPHRRGGASPWLKVYGPEEKSINYHPAELTMSNLRAFSAWLSRQGPSPAPVCAPPVRPVPPMQRSLVW